MRRSSGLLLLVGVFLSSSVFTLAQHTQGRDDRAPQATASLPRLIRITGILKPADGRPLAQVETITLRLYAEDTSDTVLWEETQDVLPDAEGRFAVLLGSTRPDGVPQAVFQSNAPRWVGTTLERAGEQEGPRVRFVSVPYALRASDADTLGGIPASAYVRATDESTSTTRSLMVDAPNVINPGTPTSLAKYTTATDLSQSNVWDLGGLVGVNTMAPRDAMHVQFTNTSGSMTGYAVQNLGDTATSYSGTLFYDHNGALGQFQGFNNITHEYRINNVARNGSSQFDGTINFMIGGTSRFRVQTDGRVQLSSGGTLTGSATTGSRAAANGWRPAGTADPSPLIIEGGQSESAGLYLDGDVAALWSPGDLDLFRIYDEDALTGAPRFVVDFTGNIRVGSGTTGCVSDADNTIIAGTCASDLRLKKDIRAFGGDMLSRALQLRPVYYRWRQDQAPHRLAAASGEAYGFIAQEVEQLFPDMVTMTEDGFKAIDYGKVPYVLLEALKEEHAKVEILESRVAALEQRLTASEPAPAAPWNSATSLVIALLCLAIGTLWRTLLATRLIRASPRGPSVPSPAVESPPATALPRTSRLRPLVGVSRG